MPFHARLRNDCYTSVYISVRGPLYQVNASVLLGECGSICYNIVLYTMAVCIEGY